MIKRTVAGIAGAMLWASMACAQFPPGTGPLVPNSPGGSSGVTANTTTCASCNANGLLYSDGTVVKSIATANSGVLVTSAGGVPSISSTLPSGLTIPGFAPLASPTFTGAVGLPVGNATTPGANFGDAGTGFYKQATNTVGIIFGGTLAMRLEGGVNGLQILNGYGFGFSSDSTFPAVDTSFYRSGVNTMSIGSGSNSGSGGSLNLTNLTSSGTVRANTGFNINGTAGASCTLTTVAHLTVVNGLVTLCN